MEFIVLRVNWSNMDTWDVVGNSITIEEAMEELKKFKPTDRIIMRDMEGRYGLVTKELSYVDCIHPYGKKAEGGER